MYMSVVWRGNNDCIKWAWSVSFKQCGDWGMKSQSRVQRCFLPYMWLLEDIIDIKSRSLNCGVKEKRMSWRKIKTLISSGIRGEGSTISTTVTPPRRDRFRICSDPICPTPTIATLRRLPWLVVMIVESIKCRIQCASLSHSLCVLVILDSFSCPTPPHANDLDFMSIISSSSHI